MTPRANATSNEAVALVLGFAAFGAIAVGALAIRHLAIGGLAIRRARFRSVEIDDLTVRRLHVIEPARSKR